VLVRIRLFASLLYERTDPPFRTTGALQERIRALMAKPAVQEVIANLVARETIAEGSTFSFHGLRKNACCYQLELDLSDTVGLILGMPPEMVRHHGKHARALMIARGAADRVNGGKILSITRANSKRAVTTNG